ncbi:ranBP1 domain-containing protein [Ditylenchus destructor]|nr:ranBP1 domain-containing protein [Ditylenchus destructor]
MSGSGGMNLQPTKGFNLQPSKLALAANQVWNESTSHFQKKTDVKIDLGLDKSIIGGGSSASENKGVSSTSSGITSGYIFGSRLAERVKTFATQGEEKPGTISSVSSSDTSGDAKSNKPTDVSSIFKRIAERTKDSAPQALWNKPSSTQDTIFEGADSTTTEKVPIPGSNGESTSGSNERLKASMDELVAKQTQPELGSTSVEPVTTGEEDEKAVDSISCKFFYFNLDSKAWIERGLGTFKINQKKADRDDIRIVGRTTGSQRVVINSKIFAGMVLEQLSDKRIKISALNADSELPQLFLIHASPVSISRVHSLLETYIGRAKEIEMRSKDQKDTVDERDSVDSSTKETMAPDNASSSRKRKPEEELKFD